MFANSSFIRHNMRIPIKKQIITDPDKLIGLIAYFNLEIKNAKREIKRREKFIEGRVGMIKKIIKTGQYVQTIESNIK